MHHTLIYKRLRQRILNIKRCCYACIWKVMSLQEVYSILGLSDLKRNNEEDRNKAWIGSTVIRGN